VLYLAQNLAYNKIMQNYSWQVIGQQKIIKYLQKNLANNRLAHAYLLAGAEHVGKSLVAKKFMAAILCQDYHEQNKIKAESYPCGTCIFCQQLAKGNHPDVYFLRKDEEKKNISVEQIREMQKLLYMSSFLNSYKIALIEQAEDLSESAQNALLKILEEPRPKTILILLANNINALLPTIISRCQVLKFLPVSQEEIFHHLLALGANREQAKIFSALALGHIGLAINFYQDQELFSDYMSKMQQFLELFSANTLGKFKIMENLLEEYKAEKGNVEVASSLIADLDFLQTILRDILALQNNLDYLLVNYSFKDKLNKLAKIYSSQQSLDLLAELRKTKKYLLYNINPRLAVENLILNFN